MVLAVGLSAKCFADGHAATAVFATGEVRVVDGNGRARMLTKDDLIFRGDTVTTKQGRAQIKFTDGGMASLREHTEYRVEDYLYAGTEDGRERSFFNLLKGSVRFVSGIVGRTNKKNFRIKTKVATIGIRGSGGLVTSCIAGSCPGKADGTYLTTYIGVLTLSSGAFSSDVHPNESYHCAADGGGCAKFETGAPARSGPIPVPELEPGYRQGEQHQDGFGGEGSQPGHPH